MNEEVGHIGISLITIASFFYLVLDGFRQIAEVQNSPGAYNKVTFSRVLGLSEADTIGLGELRLVELIRWV